MNIDDKLIWELVGHGPEQDELLTPKDEGEALKPPCYSLSLLK